MAPAVETHLELDSAHDGRTGRTTAHATIWPSGGDCEEALRTLYYFLDGELTPERRQAIQRHLDECSPCLEAFDFEAELKMVGGPLLPGPGSGGLAAAGGGCCWPRHPNRRARFV